MQLKMLVLPAPFGPMIAKRSPAPTSTLTPARAATPPKLRCNPSRASSAMRAYALPRSGEGHANGPPVVSMTDESVKRLSGNSIQGMEDSPEGWTVTPRVAGRYVTRRLLSIYRAPASHRAPTHPDAVQRRQGMTYDTRRPHTPSDIVPS